MRQDGTPSPNIPIVSHRPGSRGGRLKQERNNVSHLPSSPPGSISNGGKGLEIDCHTFFPNVLGTIYAPESRKRSKTVVPIALLVGTHAQFLFNKPRTENIDSSRSIRFLREEEKKKRICICCVTFQGRSISLEGRLLFLVH